MRERRYRVTVIDGENLADEESNKPTREKPTTQPWSWQMKASAVLAAVDIVLFILYVLPYVRL